MAKNRVYDQGKQFPITVPSGVVSGDPTFKGSMTAVAVVDRQSDGKATVDFGGVYSLSVKGVDDAGNHAIAEGDQVFYVDADTPKLSAKASGLFFGYALEAVGSGATATIKVKQVEGAGPGTLDLPAGSISQAKLAPNSLTGTVVANGADNNVIGAIPVLFRVAIAAGALADTDVVVTNKVRVVDAWLVLTGAGVATTTLQVKNGANAITNAMAASGSAAALVRAATLDSTYHEIAAGGTLRVTSATGASQPNAVVYILAERVA